MLLTNLLCITILNLSSERLCILSYILDRTGFLLKEALKLGLLLLKFIVIFEEDFGLLSSLDSSLLTICSISLETRLKSSSCWLVLKEYDSYILSIIAINSFNIKYKSKNIFNKRWQLERSGRETETAKTDKVYWMR